MKRPLTRALALILVLSFCLGLFSACRKSELMALYFVVSPGDGVSFDPQIAGGGLPETVVRNVFEGLVYINEKGEAEPGVAESWRVSEDGTTYTFDLRKDAVWHFTRTAMDALSEKLGETPDTRVTANDFVFALRRAADPATGSEKRYLLSNVQNAGRIEKGELPPEELGVKALSDDRLEIRLELPQADFLEVLGEPLCMPCNEAVFEATGGRYGLFIRCIVSNGPFYMTRFDLDEGSARMEKSPDYVGDHRARADVIWLYDKTDAAALADNLKEKIYSGAVADASLRESLPEKKFVSIGTPDRIRGFLLNPESETFKSYYFRRAFLAATPLDTLLESAGETPAAALAPGIFADLQPTFTGLVDPDAAAALLKTGLETVGADSVPGVILSPPELELPMRRLLQNYQKTLGIGLALQIETVSPEDLVSRVAEGSFDIAFTSVQAKSFSPAGYFDLFLADRPGALVGLEDAPLSAAVAALRYLKTPTKAAFSAAEDALIDAAIFLPAWQEDSLFIVRRDVTGVRVLPGINRIYFYNAGLGD